MQTELKRVPIETIPCDAAILVAFEDQKDRLPAIAQELYESKEFAGKALEMALVHRPAGFAARRLLLVGGGKPDKFTTAELRKAAGAAVRHLKSKSIKEVAVLLNGGVATPEGVAAAVEGAILGNFDPDAHKSEKNGNKSVDRITVTVPGGGDELEAALRRSQILAECQNFARELINEPSNRLTPTVLAVRARQMASEHGLGCEVLDQDRMRQLGMGALLGVAQGSAEPPALIVLRYRPETPAPGGAHLGLVGKGVTFDSGGLSIKPADGMEKMKYDMAGGAAVLGAMRAIAQLQPAIPVTALIPTVENMTGSRAQRPGDIVTSLSGKTIEVLNTDAEGRLILADALTYAQRLGCTHLVDAATLTGAIVVALGHINVGVFSSDDELRLKVMTAAAAEGEKMWHMPLDDDYKDYLKSAFADLPNIGGRWGGAVTAAMFLKEFAGKTPWVHLDIAGTAWLDEAKPHMAKGPSGVCVRTMVRLALGW
ncbi:MAG: leucyl aminopeptidase [Candidatus Solibacter usitatus]|nr:leucyl aminopeptidase [Candidatus Solibacter usitatus]